MLFWHNPTHVRPYSKGCLGSELEKAGFEAVEHHGAKYCLHPLRVLAAVLTLSDPNNRNILVARKRK
ncbi:MAG: hypothetical protein V1875_02660 [Candidatus Altiarchaeota archaeon]